MPNSALHTDVHAAHGSGELERYPYLEVRA
jgi:hypothetical protein